MMPGDLPIVARAPAFSSRGWRAVALLAALYSTVACGWAVAREWDFFHAGAVQKSRLLRLPGLLAETDREILREQQALVRIQGEIRTRLGQK